jgi:hypothetical protein
MNLDEALLQKLADWRPNPDGGRQTLHVPDQGAGWALTLTVDRADQLGCLVWELDARRTTPPAEADSALAAWADRVAARVTGLLEPLKVVEVDLPRRLAMLRSATPVQRGDHVFYYEVMLATAGTASLRRYQARPQGNGRRDQVAFALTHEALAKVAADVTANG